MTPKIIINNPIDNIEMFLLRVPNKAVANPDAINPPATDNINLLTLNLNFPFRYN